MVEFKPAWHQRNGTLAVAALAITLAVHLIFALLVRPVSGHENAELSAPSGIVLLTPHGLSAPQWRRLCRWVRENDPAIVADSSSPYGYSTMRQAVEPERQLHRRDPLAFPPSPFVPPAVSPLKETQDPLRTVMELPQNNAAPPAQQPPAAGKPALFDETSRPLVREDFQQAFQQWRSRQTDLPEKPKMPTEIRWRTSRPELFSSCGVPALDEFALAVLSSPRHRPAGCSFLTIYWPVMRSPGEVKK